MINLSSTKHHTVLITICHGVVATFCCAEFIVILVHLLSAELLHHVCRWIRGVALLRQPAKMIISSMMEETFRQASTA